MPKFKEGSHVKLREAIVDLGLDTTKVGVVWAYYNTVPMSYEVTFTDNEGVAFDITLSENELVLARRSPFKKRVKVSDVYIPAHV